MNWISIVVYAIGITYIIGMLWTKLWYAVKDKCYENGDIVRGYQLLKVATAGYLFPVSFAGILLYDMLADGTKGFSFVSSLYMQSISLGVFIPWAFGCLLCIIGYTVSIVDVIKQCMEKSEKLTERECALVERVKMTLQIRRPVIVKRIHRLQTPFMVGCIIPVICLADMEIDEEQLEIILTHELVHCKQQDGLWKMIFMVLTTVFWFTPTVWDLSREYQNWSEASCDIRACQNRFSANRYFNLILDMLYLTSENVRIVASTWQSGAEGLKWRIECMKQEQKVKKNKRLISLLTAGVLVMNTVCAFGAERGLELASEKLFLMTTTEVNETTMAEEGDELVEYVGSQSMFEGMIVKEGDVEAGSGLARATKTFSWDVDTGTVVKSAIFQKNATDTIYVTAIIDPENVWVRIGVVYPSGELHFVNAASSVSHTFELDETGYYRVFVANSSGTDVTVSGAYR